MTLPRVIPSFVVIPAKAGIQPISPTNQNPSCESNYCANGNGGWIPAFAGMT